ncbi:hypothetical protein [Photobacterium sp.]|uniref:hypothetical protein n=1 Tax=Photobacterium sp. TaxID=660 RepID=UPI00299D7AD9|nr:hypothetical protein [Photobacterium sp.]MDX1301186.1 hypothetical protein [Photobacterium sp.]
MSEPALYRRSLVGLPESDERAGQHKKLLDAVRAAIKRQPATAKDEQDWQQELASWGVSQNPEPKVNDDIEVWQEHAEVLEWWLTIPAFLRWNGFCCLGMDVCQVKADADLSGRTINPDDYQKLKSIASVMAEELNLRE